MSTLPRLHTHSHYSLLKALPKIPDLVAQAKKEGCDAVALTDFDNLYGAIEFYKECKEQGLKPILGLDAHVGEGKRLVLLVENEIGYKNLLALVSEANLHAFDTTIFSRESLFAHKEGLFAVVPMLHGELSGAIEVNDMLRAKRILKEYRDIFGDDRVYLGVGVYDDNELPEAIQSFARTQRIPIVAAQETMYLNRGDRKAWTTMRAIERIERESEENDIDLSFYSTSELEKLFVRMPEALEAARALSERCNLTLALGTWVFPNFSIPKDSSFNAELRVLIEEGLQKRAITDEPGVRERIEYEYSIICGRGYAPYFLVVADLLKFARLSGILTTTRGSAAGSLISYLIGITNVDPLAYQLPFERFLNPERPSAPDIDMDFADNRRDEVIEYARQKYGEDHVAQIGTFGTMLARGVVRDVTRALGQPYGLGDRIAKEIPLGSQGFPMTLDRAIRENTTLATMYKDEPETKEIIDLGRKIEGCARHISVHAAGIVIGPKPLSEFTPLQKDPKGGKIITQYDMYSIEDAGLLKFDFLGIRNLAILAHSIELVEKIHGTNIDIENIPLNNKATFEMLARGETEGVFQLNGTGMTRYLKELKPSSIHDINAMVALFRPGPMESIPAYIERKHNSALIHYLDPRMREYLDASYGLLVYQDDVLLTSIKLAGYSWIDADKLRKAMGKKIPKVMQAEKEKLIKGFMSYGKLPKSVAEHLWKLIEPFAAYGFGKSHAASYGKVAYQTAYMKANYPVEYMAAVLTAEAGNIETVSVMVAECKRMSIPVLPPDVNESFGDFTVIASKGQTPSAIRFGLYSIKNFGRGTADTIISERKAHGKFTSLSDFLRRLKDQSLNKKGLESLIACGALDGLSERGIMLKNIELLLEYRRDSTRDQEQDSLFALDERVSDLRLESAPSATLQERLRWEKELLGLYVSGHPLDSFKEKLSKRTMSLRELKQKIPPGAVTIAAGMVADVRTILTRSGDQMAFIKLIDFDDTLEVVIFPKNFKEHRNNLKPEMFIALRGRLSTRNGELSLVADALRTM